MPESVSAGGADHADAGWDSYAERVVRNEGRLLGLERLVSETRESDSQLIKQRSDSLAAEMERRADSLLELVTARADAIKALGEEERDADRRELANHIIAHQMITTELRDGIRRENEIAQTLLRELYDSSIGEVRSSLHDGLAANETQSTAALQKIEQMVRQWRDSDREARELFAAELGRHLDTLNHNNERMREFQANSVTRELWTSEKNASMSREAVLRDQIIALDRTVLTMTPLTTSDKTHAAMMERMESEIASAAKVLTSRIESLGEKVSELKSYRDTTQGRSSGYGAVYGWGIAAITVMISVIVMANAFLGR